MFTQEYYAGLSDEAFRRAEALAAITMDSQGIEGAYHEAQEWDLLAGRVGQFQKDSHDAVQLVAALEEGEVPPAGTEEYTAHRARCAETWECFGGHSHLLFEAVKAVREVANTWEPPGHEQVPAWLASQNWAALRRWLSGLRPAQHPQPEGWRP